MNKFNLQIVTGLLGIVPLATGLLGMMGVNNPEYLAAGVPPIVLLDTNLRFYSGVWVGAGLALWWLIPRISSHQLGPSLIAVLPLATSGLPGLTRMPILFSVPCINRLMFSRGVVTINAHPAIAIMINALR